MKKIWELISKKNAGSEDEIVSQILKNRGLKEKKDQQFFFSPTLVQKITLKDMQLDSLQIKKAIERLKKAKKNKEHIVVYGDYDADGICATAILWETLYKLGFDVLPYIPERFSEGYGINPDSVEKLKNQNENTKLIITVDNGIVAYKGIKKAEQLGIDVVVIDHHQKGKNRLNAFSTVHSTVSSGSALSWIFAREVLGKNPDSLELVAIGTIADQISLTGVNRSLVKYGLEALNSTKRLGIRAMFREAGVESAGTFEVGYIIAPRLNAAGRLTHAVESLRLVCTRDFYKANDLAQRLGRVNKDRQKIVEDVLKKVDRNTKDNKDRIIVVSGKDYHEGVIGLAAGKITEKYFRPSIVLSINKEDAKASARSIPGFDIISAIKKLEKLIIEGGGHPMAAGFTIKTQNIEKFSKEINKIAKEKMTKEILTPRIRIDLKLGFNQLNQSLMNKINKMSPFGLGNPAPLFLSERVEVVDSRKVGAEQKHLKLKLKQEDIVFDAIAFGLAQTYSVQKGSILDIVYSLDENSFGGNTMLQLKIKDLKVVQRS